MGGLDKAKYNSGLQQVHATIQGRQSELALIYYSLKMSHAAAGVESLHIFPDPKETKQNKFPPKWHESPK